MGALTQRTQALGPAIGTTGAGLSGPGVVVATVDAGKYLGMVSARLRTRSLSAPVQSGSVLVQVALLDATHAGGTAADSDVIEDGSAAWADARYVSTGRGATWHPNVYCSERMVVVARVWNRDNLDATRRIIVDLAATSSERPIPGAESGHQLGDCRPGTGTIRTVTAADPAAGSESSHATPAGVRWLLHAWKASLVASGVATRHVHLAAGMRIRGAQATQADGTTYTYDVASVIGSATVSANSVPIPLGDVYLVGGDAVATTTTSLQAADNWGAAQLRVEEWVVPGVAA